MSVYILVRLAFVVVGFVLGVAWQKSREGDDIVEDTKAVFRRNRR